LPMSGWISQHGGGIGQTREISHGPVTMSACLPPSHPGSPARVSWTRRSTSCECRSNSKCSSTATRSPTPRRASKLSSSCSEPTASARGGTPTMGHPPTVRRRDDEAEGAPLDWVEVLDAPPSEHGSIRPTVTHLARQFDGKVVHTSYMWGHTDRPESESVPAALLARAAAATRVGVLVTNRDQLTGGGVGSMARRNAVTDAAAGGCDTGTLAAQHRDLLYQAVLGHHTWHLPVARSGQPDSALRTVGRCLLRGRRGRSRPHLLPEHGHSRAASFRHSTPAIRSPSR
jgi:hypothetical protein